MKRHAIVVGVEDYIHFQRTSFAHNDAVNRPGFAGDSILREDGVMAKTKSRAKRAPEEVRERAVQMALEHGEP